MPDDGLVIENASKHFASFIALQSVHLCIERGQFVLLAGANGAGKSTLLHLLGALDRSDAGAVRVSDRELTAMSDSAVVEFRNRHVGFVFQFHHLLPEFNAAENVEMPMRVARIPRGQSRQIGRAHV